MSIRATLKLAAIAIAISGVFVFRHGFTRAADQQQESQRAGGIGRTYKDSKPAWELPPQAPKGAPNVIYLVLDDVGYAQLGCYGSEIQTPNLDRLAAGGLRYSNFHTTSLCSPSRACLLTGHNHHINHLGVITEAATGYPGYDGRMPRSQATIGEMLKQTGYSTFYVGKWHQAPPDETSDSGPYDHWPLGMGFERFYGFLGGETNQWFPDLVTTITASTVPIAGYHLTEDLTDRAIQFIAEQKEVTPTSPSFSISHMGPATPRITSPGSTSTCTRASSTRDGTRFVKRRLRGRSKWESCRRILSLRRATPMLRPGLT